MIHKYLVRRLNMNKLESNIYNKAIDLGKMTIEASGSDNSLTINIDEKFGRASMTFGEIFENKKRARDYEERFRIYH